MNRTLLAALAVCSLALPTFADSTTQPASYPLKPTW